MSKRAFIGTCSNCGTKRVPVARIMSAQVCEECGVSYLESRIVPAPAAAKQAAATGRIMSVTSTATQVTQQEVKS